MLAVVWRVMGETFDVDAFVREFALAPDGIWRKGESRTAGAAPHRESGFNLSLDRDDDDLAHALEDLRVFLQERRPVLTALQERGLESTVDIGITVGSDRHFTRTMRIPSANLAELGRSGVALEFSAYPCSDEEEPRPRFQPAGPAGD